MNNITFVTFPTLTRKQDGTWLTSCIPFKVGPASKKWMLGQIRGLMYHGIANSSCNSYMSKISLTKIFLAAYMSPQAFHWAAHHSQPQPHHLCLSSSWSQRFSAVQCKICCHQRWEAAPKPKHTILPSHFVCRHHSNHFVIRKMLSTSNSAEKSPKAWIFKLKRGTSQSYTAHTCRSPVLLESYSGTHLYGVLVTTCTPIIIEESFHSCFLYTCWSWLDFTQKVLCHILVLSLVCHGCSCLESSKL